jgi:hypothetical protein
MSMGRTNRWSARVACAIRATRVSRFAMTSPTLCLRSDSTQAFGPAHVPSVGEAVVQDEIAEDVDTVAERRRHDDEPVAAEKGEIH